MSYGTVSDERPVDPDDELLVAYLDGELDTQLRDEVERRLMDDDALRKRLQSLQLGWDWLDDLPEATPSEKLVESTLEMVVSDIVKPKPTMASPWQKFRWPLTVVAICLIAGGATWAAVDLADRRQYRAQLESLEIAENLDAYLRGRDLKLMRQLAANQSWQDMVSSAKAVGSLQVDLTSSIASVSVDEREAAIAEMSVGDRAQLATRWERFTRLEPEDVNQVRQTAAMVSVQPDPDQLLETMRVYAVWRETLPRELTPRIESDDDIERRTAIDEAIQITKTQLSRRSGSIMDDEAVEPILFALHKIIEQRIESLDSAGRGFYQGLTDRLGIEEAQLILMRFLMLRNDDRMGRPRRGPPMGAAPNLQPLSDQELMMITTMLPNRVLRDLDRITAGDPEFEAMVVLAWAEEAVRRETREREGGQTSMFDRYMELDPVEREMIDLLPPQEMLDHLKPSDRRFRPPFGRGFGR